MFLVKKKKQETELKQSKSVEHFIKRFANKNNLLLYEVQKVDSHSIEKILQALRYLEKVFDTNKRRNDNGKKLNIETINARIDSKKLQSDLLHLIKMAWVARKPNNL